MRKLAVAVGGLVALLGSAVPAVAATASTALGSAATYVPLAPVRVLDTRDSGRLAIGPASTVEISLAKVVPATAVAVVVNVTGVAPTESTFITVHPRGSARRTASTLNLTPGQIRANLTTVRLGTESGLAFYNNSGSTHVIADLAGYYTSDTTAGGYTAVAGTRVLDTRSGKPMGAGAVTTIDFTGKVGDGATAVAFNLTAVGATQPTFVTAWPSDKRRPMASNLNVSTGDSTPNLVVVALSADRKVSLYNHSGSIHLLADMVGYYAVGSGHAFHPVDPTRLLDTRPARGLGPGATTSVTLSGVLPADAGVIVANFTGTNTTASTYVSAWPLGQTRPPTSNLNLVAGQTAANMAILRLGDDKGIQIYNNSGYVDVIIDYAGYFDTAEV